MVYSIEEVASKWLAKKEERTTILDELKEIEERIAHTKKMESLEREYAEIAGLQYKGVLSELERRKQELRGKLQTLEKDQQQLTRNFFEEIEKLILPLPPRPAEEDGLFIFKYREGEKFLSTIATLEKLLRLKPLVIKNVTFKEACLEVKAADESEAKRKVILAVKELRLLAEIYLSPQLIDTCEKLRRDRYRAIWGMISSKTSATLEELSKQTGQEYEKVRQACYDLTRDRGWKPFPPPVKIRARGVYELTLVGRIISIRYYEVYGQKEITAHQHPSSTSISLNRFLRSGADEN
jgi:hypothetical protein